MRSPHRVDSSKMGKIGQQIMEYHSPLVQKRMSTMNKEITSKITDYDLNLVQHQSEPINRLVTKKDSQSSI